ncbi:hypothetical protein GCM10025873_19440 [Demequina sediminis]|nr:hypothetical protein GCM10025873_19440 [Demequina sediminis]
MTMARVVRLVAAVGMAVIGVLWASSPDTKWPGVGLVVVAVGMVATEVGRIRREAHPEDLVSRDD